MKGTQDLITEGIAFKLARIDIIIQTNSLYTTLPLLRINKKRDDLVFCCFRFIGKMSHP